MKNGSDPVVAQFSRPPRRLPTSRSSSRRRTRPPGPPTRRTSSPTSAATSRLDFNQWSGEYRLWQYERGELSSCDAFSWPPLTSGRWPKVAFHEFVFLGFMQLAQIDVASGEVQVSECNEEPFLPSGPALQCTRRRLECAPLLRHTLAPLVPEGAVADHELVYLGASSSSTTSARRETGRCTATRGAPPRTRARAACRRRSRAARSARASTTPTSATTSSSRGGRAPAAATKSVASSAIRTAAARSCGSSRGRSTCGRRGAPTRCATASSPSAAARSSIMTRRPASIASFASDVAAPTAPTRAPRRDPRCD